MLPDVHAWGWDMVSVHPSRRDLPRIAVAAALRHGAVSWVIMVPMGAQLLEVGARCRRRRPHRAADGRARRPHLPRHHGARGPRLLRRARQPSVTSAAVTMSRRPGMIAGVPRAGSLHQPPARQVRRRAVRLLRRRDDVDGRLEHARSDECRQAARAGVVGARERAHRARDRGLGVLGEGHGIEARREGGGERPAEESGGDRGLTAEDVAPDEAVGVVDPQALEGVDRATRGTCGVPVRVGELVEPRGLGFRLRLGLGFGLLILVRLWRRRLRGRSRGSRGLLRWLLGRRPVLRRGQPVGERRRVARLVASLGRGRLRVVERVERPDRAREARARRATRRRSGTSARRHPTRS